MDRHEDFDWFDAAPKRVPSGDGVEVAKARRLLRVMRNMVDLQLPEGCEGLILRSKNTRRAPTYLFEEKFRDPLWVTPTDYSGVVRMTRRHLRSNSSAHF